ncbi:Uncharacterized protein APZ42_012339 [Daphnia magna]|uniref:Uncharacterized protein n=1 Tax=Daphnia magna TaxID=35525 RepID=A0A162RXJ6_9CRUS|nr:Uncharacterized protein APZ42_012339 [Daphnia magna]
MVARHGRTCLSRRWWLCVSCSTFSFLHTTFASNFTVILEKTYWLQHFKNNNF